MLTIINNFKQDLKFRDFQMHKYTPKFKLNLEFGAYTLKTAQTLEEIKAALKLRYQNFYKVELAQGEYLYDVDAFDAFCDHLIIVENESKKVVGTYRLNNSSLSKDFYSSTEFDIQKLVYCGKNCVELGRACIDPEYRSGMVITLLWRGIYIYMKEKNADILFGCSSIKNVNARQASLLSFYFEKMDYVSKDFKANPSFTCKMPLFDDYRIENRFDLFSEELEEIKRLLPALLKSYLKLGAKVAAEPAYDKDMDCIDFLTILKIENLKDQVERKFRTEKSEQIKIYA